MYGILYMYPVEYEIMSDDVFPLWKYQINTCISKDNPQIIGNVLILWYTGESNSKYTWGMFELTDHVSHNYYITHTMFQINGGFVGLLPHHQANLDIK